MDFWVRAVSPRDYDRFLHGQPLGTGTGTGTA
jgi:hypothetical protein